MILAKSYETVFKFAKVTLLKLLFFPDTVKIFYNCNGH